MQVNTCTDIPYHHIFNFSRLSLTYFNLIFKWPVSIASNCTVWKKTNNKFNLKIRELNKNTFLLDNQVNTFVNLADLQQVGMTEENVQFLLPAANLLQLTDVRDALCHLFTLYQVEVTEENVQSLLPAANLLQLTDVRDACCDFLQAQLHPTNCLGIRRWNSSSFHCRVVDPDPYSEYGSTQVKKRINKRQKV